MRNVGSDVLRCIVVGERLAHDIGDYPRLRKRLYRHAGRPWDLVEHNAIAIRDLGVLVTDRHDPHHRRVSGIE